MFFIFSLIDPFPDSDLFLPRHEDKLLFQIENLFKFWYNFLSGIGAQFAFFIDLIFIVKYFELVVFDEHPDLAVLKLKDCWRIRNNAFHGLIELFCLNGNLWGQMFPLIKWFIVDEVLRLEIDQTAFEDFFWFYGG